MKYTKVFVLGAVILASLSSCDNLANKMVEKIMDKGLTTFDLDTAKWGAIQEKNLEVTKFHKIEAHGAVGIEYKQDTAYSVKVVACQKGMDKYNVYVEDEELCIDLKDTYAMNVNKNTPGMIIYVSAPYISKYDMSGACRIELHGKIENDEDVEIEISGAAKIDIEDLRCRNFELDASGVAKAAIDNLKCKENAFVEIAGAGKVKMNVNCKIMDARVSGAGKVTLSGKADRLKTKTSGASNVDTSDLKRNVSDTDSSANDSETKE